MSDWDEVIEAQEKVVRAWKALTVFMVIWCVVLVGLFCVAWYCIITGQVAPS